MSWLPNWLTGYDADNAARAKAADSELRELKAIDYAPGGRIYQRAAEERGTAYADTLLDRVQLNFDAQPSFDPEEQQREIDRAFAQGASEGLSATQEKFKGWLNSIGLGVLGFIPWWVWLLAAGYALWRLGGVAWLKKRLA